MSYQNRVYYSMIKKEKLMNRASCTADHRTRLDKQFPNFGDVISCEDSGNDYTVIAHDQITTQERLVYDHRTKLVNPPILVKVNWAVKKFLTEGLTSVTCELNGEDNRGRTWHAIAEFDIHDREDAYDAIEDEDFYIVHIMFNKITEATCAQDYKDMRIDSAQGLI